MYNSLLAYPLYTLLGTVFNIMKKKVIETLERKEAQLQEVLKLQETETKKSKLNDLDKNEIEIKAQISILRHLLSE
jgi:hypothetical protein